MKQIFRGLCNGYRPLIVFITIVLINEADIFFRVDIRAGLVEKLREYRWSSYHDYVNVRKKNKWVDSDAVLEVICSNQQESRREYRKLIREASGRKSDFLAETKYGMILGSDKFVEWVQGKFIDRREKEDLDLPQKKRICDNGVIERVIEVISQNYKVDKTTLLERKRHIPFEARDVSMYILKMYTGLTNKVIGEMFGVSISAVNKAAIRINDQTKASKEFKEEIEQDYVFHFQGLTPKN